MSRWTLPGPDHFLATMVDDLHHGGAVVTRLPTTVGADDILAEVVRRLPYTYVDHVDTRGGLDGRMPGDVVAEHAGIDGAGWTASALAAEAQLEGRILCMTGAEATADAAVWASWVSEFASASASADAVAQPPVVLLLVSGDANGAAPAEDPRVRVHWWWGTTDRLDVAVHLKRLVPDLDAVDREQIIEVVGADLELAERLAGAGCRDEQEIANFCLERSEELGLTAPDEPFTRQSAEPGYLEAHWCAGSVDMFEGRVHWHPGLLVTTRRGALRRRLWTAQIRTLLPTIDLLRMELIELIRRHRLLPESLLTLDLEVGELSRRLARINDDHQLSELAEWLRRSRNLLAHLEVVSSATRDRGTELAARARLAR